MYLRLLNVYIFDIADLCTINKNRGAATGARPHLSLFSCVVPARAPKEEANVSNQRIHVVVNPAAGQDTAVLQVLNRVFQEVDVDWSLSITKGVGDAKQQAQDAIAQGATTVAVYGGDGTVAEAMSGLVGHDVPLAILPGGTANAMANELRIPVELAQACRLACGQGSRAQPVDGGLVNGQFFMLRVATGLEAATIEQTERSSKTKLGNLAYWWAALQNIVNLPVARYTLRLDGREEETEGLTCMVANSGNIGLPGSNIVPTISVCDGLLDVLVVQRANVPTLLKLLGSMAGVTTIEQDADAQEPNADDVASIRQAFQQSLHYWQVREVTIGVDPPQTVQCDGEILDAQTIHCAVLPQAVQVLVPQASETGAS